MPGGVFRFELAFENLTDWELGALLWALALPDTPHGAHLLGLGKPIGLGALKTTIRQVTLIDRPARYQDPFASGETFYGSTENGNPPADLDKGMLSEALDAFREKVSSWSAGKQFASLDQVKDLCAILSQDMPPGDPAQVQISYPPGLKTDKPKDGTHPLELHYRWFGQLKWSQRLLTIQEIADGSTQTFAD